MAVTDPIADLLTKLRNASRAGHAQVDVSASRLKVHLLEILKREGFIRSFQPMQAGARKEVRVYLKFIGRRPILTQAVRISKPALRKYVGAASLPKVISGRGIAVLSTSRGLMTDAEARQQRVGGEVLCHVW